VRWPTRGKAWPQATAAADYARGHDEQAQAQAFGFPAAGGPGEREHGLPGEQLAGQGTISHQIWFWA